PTVLMGGTIPLLTQGLSRNLADATRFHAFVYAFNTTGAFAGALAAAFVLIPWLGLESTVMAMGGVNLAAGITFLVLNRHERVAIGRERDRSGGTDAAAAPTGAASAGVLAFCAVAMLAGFAMMSLQTVVNRIGGFALGASHFTFAMVVATFVLSIALGSFAVSALARVRAAHLLASQWTLVILLLLLYVRMDDAPYWAHAMRLSFADDASSFLPFHFAAFLGILCVLGLPLALSGALLPLIFHHLRREAADVGEIAGRVYCWNTLGSLLGALLGGYLLLFWLDLDDVYRLGVFALAVAAAISTGAIARRARVAAASVAAGVAALLLALPGWDPERLSAGLFRYRDDVKDLGSGPDDYFAGSRREWADDFVLFYDDDPTTSVAVFDTSTATQPRGRSIVTNGKSDGNIPGDNLTQGLLALLPAMFAEKCERAFVIGYGTGMSVGELAALDSTEQVVVAEISQGVLDAAPLFERENRGALTSPKTRIVRSDAYRTLMRGHERFDVIVSEPSNPWVTGVEMLYAREFLAAAKDRLAPGGVYAQWFHTYETDDRSVALVLNTFRVVFERVSVWYGRGTDLIILGFENREQPVDLARLAARWQRPDFRRQLEALPIRSFPRLLAHEALPLGVVERAQLPDRVHSILHPILSHDTARAFFLGAAGGLPEGLAREAAAAGARNSLIARYRASFRGAFPAEQRLELLRETCDLDLSRCATLFAQWLHEEPDSQILAVSLARARTSEKYAAALQPDVLNGLDLLFRADGSRHLPPTFEVASDLSRVFAKYYHHAAPFDPGSMHELWRRCAGTDDRCAARVDEVLGWGPETPRLSRR
ncbi:MAG: fused MFS/spermidine synthase, partial [Myxococcota bacterium]